MEQNIKFRKLHGTEDNQKLKDKNIIYFSFVDINNVPLPNESLVCVRRLDGRQRVILHHSSWAIDQTKRVSLSINAHDSPCK